MINPSVDYTIHGDVAVIAVDNPPVNAIKQQVRAGIIEGLARLAADPALKAGVIACKGRTFIAGADISEFGKPPLSPSLPDVLAAIDAMAKPVVAAIHGTALGGGFEIALTCHARVATIDARVGLPEVKLGLLPGASGTQRLPRAIGAAEAIRWIVYGDQIPAPKALAAGAIDAIAEGDLLDAALTHALAMAAEGRLPRLRDDDSRIGSREAFEAAAADLLKRAGRLDAPPVAVAAIRMVFSLPFDEALPREREAFLALMAGDQSKALRHIFFAEREAGKAPALPDGAKPGKIETVAVLGGGTMGGGIAMAFANAGIPVTLIETTDDNLARGLARIEANWRASRGMGEAEVTRRLALVTGKVGLEAAADADLIVEAVFEDMALKQQIFADLDRLAKPGAILATNTSYLDIDTIAAATTRPEAVLGMHFFSPANIMRLLEVVRARHTSPQVLAAALAIGRKIGKVTVEVGVCHGFVGNRMLSRRTAQVERLLLEGALPEQIDAAARQFGFAMGPCAVSDLAGLDIGWRNRQALGVRFEIADSIVEAGRLGQKSGSGYFRYEPGSRAPLPDPEVVAIIKAASARAGLTRRAIPETEIVERLLYPMIDEGAKILAEGIARNAADIDVVWVFGYGFPNWRGGPMFHGDAIGVRVIRDRLAALAMHTGDASLAPSARLNTLASADVPFATAQGS